MIAYNPKEPPSPVKWIIHLDNPKAIIRCTPGRVESEIIGKEYKTTDTGNIWTLSAHHFFTTDFISEPEEQVRPLLDNAFNWFKNL